MDERPDCKVRFETGNETITPLLDGIGAFHDGHGRQETSQVCGSKDTLIRDDTGKEGSFGAVQDDVTLEDTVPGGGSGSEDRCYMLACPLALYEDSQDL